ncbi:unnamed protein product [Prorocentrum cordatum]|uniref:Uncharacterized protein n=1 Tax=Prorocentrum cordatum TaxID=2364126 RepID=A0ABN9U4Y1_9DINO|nr:unnamed protein product [Polarella glacialis]
MLKQSLEDEGAYNVKEKKEEEAFLADTGETKATATGELAKTVALLEETTAALESTQAECMKTASDHDASKTGRAEELKVLAEAKKILLDTTSGAVSQTYNFLQALLLEKNGAEGGSGARPRRSPGEHKAARDYRAVVELSEELSRAKPELDATVEALDGPLGGARVEGRVRASLPALTAFCPRGALLGGGRGCAGTGLFAALRQGPAPP